MRGNPVLIPSPSNVQEATSSPSRRVLPTRPSRGYARLSPRPHSPVNKESCEIIKISNGEEESSKYVSDGDASGNNDDDEQAFGICRSSASDVPSGSLFQQLVASLQ